MAQWRNWSGSVTARPARLATPRTEAELADIIRAASKVRVVGAGHSFMPLCETDGALVSLSELEGAVESSADRSRVWAPAGWSLAKLTAALWEEGLSLINQGDVNPQSLAGAIGTGTHGTGATLGSLSTTARAFRLMQADGSIISCSAAENNELYQAARLSLGLVGVATRIEIDVLPAYHLEERVESHPFEYVAENWDELVANNRHVEFFVFPYGDQAILKTLNPAPNEGPLKHLNDMDDRAFKLICDLCATFPVLTRRLQPLIVKPGIRQRRVGPAFQIFPSERSVRFEEMEYEVPVANGWAALREAIAYIRRRKLPITFPFEFRAIAADDIWLSPFHAGPCVSISAHQYSKMPWRDFFAGIEPIFRAHGGRPHWAKRHTLTKADVDALYPNAARFGAVRATHDPHAKFANAHLTSLFVET
ncbi:D-arabinono-1,4-lactone oxidase [Terricaulis sp.]|uniref:D-arabinono-1,4-lactone oxidase n=1 Tax=Terricaulis sp. TaxID=2768686 RepID=UPI002AC6D785|nr:D-arabinono-1,4-lactone oxidase [Terricaulis sp.]MDZ4690351.1 D-arabinono-1,4-lactone oxidase [Terricaulis sp.]